jgi:integrase
VRGPLTEAKQVRADKLDRITRGEYVSPNKMTVDEWFDRWLATVKRTKRASLRRHSAIDEVTVADYEKRLGGTIRDHLGPLRLQELEAEHIERYYDWALDNEITRLGKKVSPNTLRKRHMALKLALDHAVQKRLVTYNAATLTAAPARVRPKRPVFSLEDVSKLLKATADTDLELMVLLAARTGLRLGEVLGLKWANLDLDSRNLKVQTTVTETPHLRLKDYPKTDAANASLKIDPSLAERMKAHKGAQAGVRQKVRAQVASKLAPDSPAEVIEAAHEAAWSDLGLVFCGPRGNMLRPSDVSRAFAETVGALETAEDVTERLSVQGGTFHTLRHAHGTHLVKAGMRVDAIQRRMRHASVQTTIDSYLHEQPGDDDELAEAAEELFGCHDDAAKPRNNPSERVIEVGVHRVSAGS